MYFHEKILSIGYSHAHKTDLAYNHHSKEDVTIIVPSVKWVTCFIYQNDINKRFMRQVLARWMDDLIKIVRIHSMQAAMDHTRPIGEDLFCRESLK